MSVAVKMRGVCLDTIFFMCVSMLTACAETEETQIRQTVERYVEALPGECLMYGSWPAENSFGSFVSNKRVEFLSKVGLAEFERPSYYRQVGRLTDEGQRYYFPDIEDPNMMARMLRGGHGGLCVGHREFLQIEEYTTPSEMRGMTMTTVRYRNRLADVPNWARTQEALQVFQESTSLL